VSRVVEVGFWWAVLTGLELMLISAVDRYELLVAIGIGLAGALLASYARSAQSTSWRLGVRALAWLPTVPASIVTDTGRVLLAAAKGDSGRWRELDLADAGGDTARARGIRALGAMVLSLSPGTVVQAVDERTGTARLHDLGGSAGSRVERAISS
jgi:hypothetical protein